MIIAARYSFNKGAEVVAAKYPNLLTEIETAIATVQKDKLGVEVQFGKYSFMVYNVAAKMTIFRNLGHINTGVEIVPIKQFALQMSSGVSYFEQFVWDLEQRGVADIDVPVLILGIDSEAGSGGKRPRTRIVKATKAIDSSENEGKQPVGNARPMPPQTDGADGI